jgi:hypothetical protein
MEMQTVVWGQGKGLQGFPPSYTSTMTSLSLLFEFVKGQFNEINGAFFSLV